MPAAEQGSLVAENIQSPPSSPRMNVEDTSAAAATPVAPLVQLKTAHKLRPYS